MTDALFLFPKRDAKFQNWADALGDVGIRTAVQSPYKPGFLFRLIAHRFRVRKLIYVVRYLNTPRSKAKTLLQAGLDLIALSLCAVLRIKVVWFLHNVDRETYDFYPAITRWRRKILAIASDRVFVMDRGLVEEAREILGVEKVDNLCFGHARGVSKFGGNVEAETQILSWLASRREAYPKAMFCLSANSPSPKNATLGFVEEMARSVPTDDLQFVVVGAGETDLSGLDNVLTMPDSFQVSDNLTQAFDFVTKVSTDRSVLLTGYNAAYNGTSVLTADCGFFAEFIEVYNLGVVYKASEDKTDFAKMMRAHLQDPNRVPALDAFRKSHNWTVAAQRLAAYSKAV